jgi:hypothetical protein
VSESETSAPDGADSWSPPAGDALGSPTAPFGSGYPDYTVPTYGAPRPAGPANPATAASAPQGYGFAVGAGGPSNHAGDGSPWERGGGDTLALPETSVLAPSMSPPDGGSDAFEAATPAPSMSAAVVTHGRRKLGRLGPAVVAVVIPSLLILLGLSLMASSVGDRTSSSSSDRNQRPRNTPSPRTTNRSSTSDTTGSNSDDTAVDGSDTPAVVTAPVPVIVVPTSGDPQDRAIGIAQTFLSALANEDFRTARAMTAADIDEAAQQNLDAASLIPVSTSQIGPDRVTMSLVVIEYRTIDGTQKTVFQCARWNISTATGRIELLASAELGEPQLGKVVPGDLAIRLAADCDDMSL